MFAAGPWETAPLLIDGKWIDIASRSIQRYELDQIRLLVGIAKAHGAHLDLLTMACLPPGSRPALGLPPDDSPQLLRIYNRLLATVASEYPRAVSLIPYGSILCPGGSFHRDLAGVQVRSQDGIHTPAYAPGNIFVGNASTEVAQRFYAWLSPRLWPLILRRPAHAT